MVKFLIVILVFCSLFADDESGGAMAADAYFKLGLKSYLQGDNDDAMRQYVRAIDYDPKYSKSYWGMGLMLLKEQKVPAAITNFKSAVAYNPNFFPAYDTLGVAYERLGQKPLAMETYLQALARCSQFDECCPRFDLGVIDSYEQWPVHELPVLKGKRILLTSDDTSDSNIIQWIRYVDELAAKGFDVSYRPSKKMAAALSQAPLKWKILDSNDEELAYDMKLPVTSMPYLFKTFPIPYLAVDNYLEEQFKERYFSHDGLKVGIAWQTDAPELESVVASISYDALQPLLAQPGVTFYALQTGSEGLVDLSDEMSDLRSMLALINQLDLVIAVDCSIAHMAAALGKETWLLLSKPANWRWYLDGDKTEWYPSMKLFRQQTKGNWSGVITQVIKNMPASAHASAESPCCGQICESDQESGLQRE